MASEVVQQLQNNVLGQGVKLEAVIQTTKATQQLLQEGQKEV